VDFDPSGTQEAVEQAKQALRRRMRSVRQALPASAAQARSARLIERVTRLQGLHEANRVGLYWPIEGRREVDVTPLHGWLRERGRAVYYPFMDPTEDGFRTGFRLANDSSQLTSRGQRFLEPPPHCPEAPRQTLDVVVVPALAADSRGYRLGYGSGFYDVTLPEHCPGGIAIVVIYHFQLLAELPVQDHDQPAAFVVTDETTLKT
jgi:5-formyltetrahydrofolate cyclo-ligase